MAYSDNNNHGYIQLMRSNEVENLIKRRPTAFVLLTIIALRARRTRDRSFDGLKIGEAYIGDHRSYGASSREYRTDKKILEQYGLATFKATTKGTIAQIADTAIFNINAENKTNELTSLRPSSVIRPTTKKNENNDKKEYTINKRLTNSNPILEDPIFHRLQAIYCGGDDASVRAKMGCQSVLNSRYPLWKYTTQWDEANKVLHGIT